MKTVAILLAILGYAAAEELSACVVTAEDKLGMGVLKFKQSTGEEKTLVSGSSWGLQPGNYTVVLHESGEFSRDCNDLGSEVQLEDGERFVLTEFEVKKGEYDFIGSPSKGTLLPNLPNSINGHRIAIYDSIRYALSERNPAISMEACGIITTGESCFL